MPARPIFPVAVRGQKFYRGLGFVGGLAHRSHHLLGDFQECLGWSTSLDDGTASEMTEREVCPENEKSDSIWPSVAVWMPNHLPYGQKRVSIFSETRSSATIGPSLRGHLRNVG